MKIKLNDKEYEVTQDVLQEVADEIMECGVLEEEKPDYPYVGIDRASIVLFYGQGHERTRTIITDEEELKNKDGWLENYFKPFTGTITYKNGKPVLTEVTG